jgi:hypothetical protein
VFPLILFQISDDIPSTKTRQDGGSAEIHPDALMAPWINRGLKNSAATFQAAVRQPAMINLIDGPARPPIETLSMTTRSSGLALSEIRTMMS